MLLDLLTFVLHVPSNVVWMSWCQLLLQFSLGLRFHRVSDDVITESQMAADICTANLERVHLALFIRVSSSCGYIIGYSYPCWYSFGGKVVSVERVVGRC